MGQAAVMADTPFAHGCPCGRGVCPTRRVGQGGIASSETTHRTTNRRPDGNHPIGP